MSRVAVDWDGTLITDDTWPDMGVWLPGAVDALWELARMYDEVVIYTCRTAPVETDEVTERDNRDQIRAIAGMLEKENLPDNVRVWWEPWKPRAKAYVDNRGLHFDGDWEGVINELYDRTRSELVPH